MELNQLNTTAMALLESRCGVLDCADLIEEINISLQEEGYFYDYGIGITQEEFDGVLYTVILDMSNEQLKLIQVIK